MSSSQRSAPSQVATFPAGTGETSDTPLCIRLLGGFSVTRGERVIPPSAWRLRKAQSLVKLLALAPGHRLHRAHAMELLWPDLDEEAAANNLHQVTHVARRALALAWAPSDYV
jgi:DNA-binding SARP family transcriptional activator